MTDFTFARGVPSPDLIPVQLVQEAAARVLRDDTAVLAYGTAGGWQPLRELLAEHHGVSPDRIIVTNGSLQAFAFVLDTLFPTPDAPQVLPTGAARACIIEAPTYDRPRAQLARRAVTEIAVPLGDDGIAPTALAEARAESGSPLSYLVPTFHNPAGCTVPEAQRSALLVAGQGDNGWIYEDDPYRRLWFDAPPPTALLDLPGADRVIHASSMSKLISPGLRVGYLVVPDELRDAVTGVITDTTISPVLLSQAIVADVLSQPAFDEHLIATRGELAARRDAMCDALDEYLPDASYVRPDGGYFLWVDLPSGVSVADVQPALAERNVSIVPGNGFGVGFDASVRLAFSCMPPDRITEGMRAFADAVNSCIATRA